MEQILCSISKLINSVPFLAELRYRELIENTLAQVISMLVIFIFGTLTTLYSLRESFARSVVLSGMVGYSRSMTLHDTLRMSKRAAYFLLRKMKKEIDAVRSENVTDKRYHLNLYEVEEVNDNGREMLSKFVAYNAQQNHDVILVLVLGNKCSANLCEFIMLLKKSYPTSTAILRNRDLLEDTTAFDIIQTNYKKEK